MIVFHLFWIHFANIIPPINPVLAFFKIEGSQHDSIYSVRNAITGSFLHIFMYVCRTESVLLGNRISYGWMAIDMFCFFSFFFPIAIPQY